ncbi:hypothetical protein [Nocardia sp. NPDC004750]
MTGLRWPTVALRWSAGLAFAAWTGGCATLLGEPAPPPSAEEIATAAAELAGLPASEVAEQRMASVGAWPGFQETARAPAASVGATDMLPGAASSPDRYVTFEGSDGAEWDSNTELSVFADARSMTITATVGCRLPADERSPR